MRRAVASWWWGPASARWIAALSGIGIAVLVVVCLPRFGATHQPDLDYLHTYRTHDGTLLRSLTVDMREYLRSTEYYAGVAEPSRLAPFTYRWGAPLLAGRVPLEPQVALNLVVMALLACGVPSVALAQRRLAVPAGPLTVTTLLFAAAFPVYYWGSFDYVDGAVVGLLAVALALLVHERRLAALLVVVAALLVKESALVGLPVFLVWVWCRPGGSRRRIGWSVAAVVAVVAGVVVDRALAPSATRFYYPWLPAPSEIQGLIGSNVGRSGPIGQVTLTAIVPSVLVVLACVRLRRGDLGAPPGVAPMLLVGVGLGVALNLQALLTAQWDGRTLWVAYPFALVLGGLALRPPDRPGGTGTTTPPVR